MAEAEERQRVPTPEKVLRDLAKNASKAIPRFEEKEPITGLRDLVDPLLETADLPDLNPGHRAAASNALCSIIESCQASKTEYARDAILDDSIWLRLFNIYLQRSDDAKGKSMRQMLLLLTSVITKNQSTRASELRLQAAATFMDITCVRQDRMKVKPAVQGLAHFLLRDVVSIAQLLEIYGAQSTFTGQSGTPSPQILLKAFLTWVVHHDTSLSAGHLVKNFLIQARRLPEYTAQGDNTTISPIWIEPVVDMLHQWPDRLREFKANVFPHCFLPNIDEYLRLLSYLRFDVHVQARGDIPQALRTYESQNNGLDRSEEFKILLAALETGKELTIVRDIDYRLCDRIEIQGNYLHLPDDIFGAWMSHSEPEVRLAGMFLSIHSTAITKPMTGGIFKSLKRNLVHLHTDTDAYFRREVHGYTQKLFDRLRASTATLSKSLIKGRTSEQGRLPLPKECFQQQSPSARTLTEDPLTESLVFIVWYTRFLEWELRSTGTYQRRITALRSLIIILKSGVDAGVPHAQLSKSAQGELNWAHSLQISKTRLMRLLLDLVLDPFDDIREASISVLQLCLAALPDVERSAVLSTLPRFIARAEGMMVRTGRADQADGVARAYSLLFTVANANVTETLELPSSKSEVFNGLRRQLTETLQVAHANLSQAVNGRPVHGIYAALTYIVDQDTFYSTIAKEEIEVHRTWVEAHNELIESFETLWSIVYNVLCADAPEGNVPDEVDEAANLDTREVLSYSWRGLKEASVLIRTIITKASIGNDDQSILTPAVFERLGRLCFTQLLELRHRGAHSTVAQTFAAFCRRCATSKIPELQALPDAWYQETLRSMQAKAGAITRRSAGIPTLMASIIAAEPEAGGKLLARAMNDLVSEASVEAQHTNIEESRLPQVHALNCIKEIFTTSKLSVASEAYIAQGLELAAKTLNSNIWPIRNCSLMLFKALIERLLGSSEAQDWKEQDRAKTSRFSYDNYPSLLSILSDLLDPSGPLKQTLENSSESSNPFDLHGAEGVFPALQILRQARPPTNELGSIRASVEKLLASPHWHMRDMAARTVVSLLPSYIMYDAAFEMLGKDYRSTNTRHGVLLAVKYMMRKLINDQKSLASQSIEALLLELINCVDRRFTHNICPFIDTVFFDIVSTCGLSILQRQESKPVLASWTQLTSFIEIGPEYELGISSESDSPLRIEALARLFIIDRVIVRPESLGTIVAQDYQSIGDALMLLAAEDPDTCCVALETLETIIEKVSSDAPKKPVSLLMAHIHCVVLNAENPEVISRAQHVLAEALANGSSRRAEFFSLLTSSQLLETLSKLETQCLSAPPSNMQSALHLLGFFLEHTYYTLPSACDTIFSALTRYIRLLRMTLIDTNPFDTRFAAAQSICALCSLWTASTPTSRHSPHVLGLGLILYDMLQDDDDEIRDLGALATSTFLSSTTKQKGEPTAPILATQHLLTHLISLFPKSGALATHALRHLSSTAPASPLFSTPFTEVVEEVTKPQTALFAQEKQNLFKDDVLDALSWSRVLSTPSLIASLPASVFESAALWTNDALAVLTDRYEEETDGALGWASKPEVFAWLLRIICLADVVLQTSAKGKTGVKLGLAKMVGAMEKAEGHGVVLEHAEKVLEEDVMRSLGVVRGVAESAPEYAVSWLSG
ncbi:HEAT repeat protein-like protein [Macroventuria anomochaeta]|uniref:HEAT repeat protein-like protein n=1 Tax=Macroventuria anomochaeta TaxID=301207 RepID=A0ACB6RUF4_9PLEO|nr:HEAT repeat protein-like protein [Macroventuria anomochaeta]KAF2624779.1 HEAT repeat protein-like protein [Macroventuria anomochaeta]